MKVRNGVNSTCDDERYSDVAEFLFLNFSFLQASSRKSLYLWWILLVNQLTENVFCNRKIVQEICHADGRHIFTHFSNGSWNCTKEITLPGFGMLWFDKVGISNIIYLINSKDKHDVRYYHDEDIFAVLKPMHEVLFNPIVGGI